MTGNTPTRTGEPIAANRKEAVVRDILHGLYEGRYHPGQRLVEADLTEVYGISRSTVREALNLLTALGLVEMSDRRGAQIRKLNVDEAIDTLLIAEGLLRIAGRAAAARIDDPGNPERIEQALAMVADCDPKVDFGASGLARDRFYQALTSVSAVSGLERVLTSLPTHVVRVEFRSALSAADDYRHYRRISDAILAGNAKAAEGAIRGQMRKAVGSLQAYRERMLGAARRRR